MGKTLRFSKKQRLVSNREFKAVLNYRNRASDGFLMLYVSPNTCGHPRLGISVGRSYGTAVQRNHLKRLIREVFRLNQFEIPVSFDYLVMPAPRRGRRKAHRRQLLHGQRAIPLSRVRESFLHLVQQVRRTT